MDTSSLEKKRSEDQLEVTHSKTGVFDEESSHWDATFRKQTLRKVDFRVLPILAAVYALSLYVSVLDHCRPSLTTCLSVSTERTLQMPMSLVRVKVISKGISL
jgi:hypothetical protein